MLIDRSMLIVKPKEYFFEFLSLHFPWANHHISELFSGSEVDWFHSNFSCQLILTRASFLNPADFGRYIERVKSIYMQHELFYFLNGPDDSIGLTADSFDNFFSLQIVPLVFDLVGPDETRPAL